ncbi:hypothetical protein L1D44_15965 [Shewanella sp. Isolate13]|uniref:hypothetical protein n=1 Tax=Shewanella sp. Isolate13 TaxID=2908531 RepID=UPI001EFC3832|nr:hypothetical protein [Shewanella sp. Isolate13]MCG9731294.1 hypothetical protein [Shewanella sp. Isolate13]
MFFQQSRARPIEEAREIYRWFMPRLRLDAIPMLVQCIKFAERIADRGSENVRLPRLTVIGEERAYVEQVIAHALETRIDLDKYNIG